MASRLMLLGAAGAVGLLVIVAAAVGAAVVFEEPAVEDVDVGWGDVTDETSEIQATIVIDNPNPVGIPAIIGIAYTATLNDVAVAEGTQDGIGLAPGRNELVVTIPIENDKIAP